MGVEISVGYFWKFSPEQSAKTEDGAAVKDVADSGAEWDLLFVPPTTCLTRIAIPG